ncbi:MAG: ABC transporter ATP-binding protein/permease, partial [Actinomycetota bacterium]|nr:ABC transporter ATP-binding protein/permease [Actinomycetota bacterium]
AFAGMLFYLDWALAIVALVVAPVYWAAARRYTGRIRIVSAEKRRLTGDMNSLAEEVLSAVPQVQAAGAERLEESRFDARGRAIRAAAMEASRLNATLRPLTDLLELTGALLVIGAGAWSVVAGRQTIGELLAFLTYLTQLYSPTRSLTDLASGANSAAAGAERVQEILDEAPDVTDPPTPIEPPAINGALSFRGVTLHYPGRDQPAVDTLELDIAPGQITAVVGPSGSGKSTIAALAMRLMDPDAGLVLLDGHDVRDYPLAFLRSAVGLLLQDTYLFHGTIADNVAYGSAADATALAGALDGADAGFVSSLGKGVHHHIGGNGRALSGGQRRRVALARVLMSAPPVLILDEFSTGQDPASVRRVLDRLRGRANTIVLITHDVSVAAIADRVVSIERGRVVADTRQTTEAS